MLFPGVTHIPPLASFMQCTVTRFSFMPARHRLIALLVASVVCVLLPSMSDASGVYRCANKAGKVEYRDYPCESAQRPAQQPSPSPPAASPTSRPSQTASLALAAIDAQIDACLRIEQRFHERNPLPACTTSDQRCFNRKVALIDARVEKMFAEPEFQRLNCAILLAPAPDKASGPEGFEVVGAIRGCKYFLAEQNASLSLVEEWLCFRPSVGETGRGDISSPGTKEVTLSGRRCTVYVDDWLMSKSRAADKLADKCGR